jgi:hypothetical protein
MPGSAEAKKGPRAKVSHTTHAKPVPNFDRDTISLVEGLVTYWTNTSDSLRDAIPVLTGPPEQPVQSERGTDSPPKRARVQTKPNATSRQALEAEADEFEA